MSRMKRYLAYALAGAVALSTGPSAAGSGKDDLRHGLELLRQGLELMLKGLSDELAPILLEIQGKIIDLSQYYPPEILPNGDIIIRRKHPLAPRQGPPKMPPAEGEIDL